MDNFRCSRMLVLKFNIFYHQSPHSLLFNSFCLFFLFSLCVGVPGSNCLRELLDFPRDGPVIFFEVLCMLQDAVEILL